MCIDIIRDLRERVRERKREKEREKKDRTMCWSARARREPATSKYANHAHASERKNFSVYKISGQVFFVKC